jgi:hypothetical protein
LRELGDIVRVGDGSWQHFQHAKSVTLCLKLIHVLCSYRSRSSPPHNFRHSSRNNQKSSTSRQV